MADFVVIDNDNAWYDKIEALAVQAAELKVKQDQEHGANHKDVDKAIIDNAVQYKERLLQKFPYSSYEGDSRKQAQFSEWKPEDVVRYLSWGDTQDGQKAYDPHNIARIKTYNKLQHLLTANPENGISWQDMPMDLLKENAAKLGHEPYTEEGMQKFWEDLREAQITQDRAGIMKDLHNEWWYLPTSVVYPSMMDEAENQIMTGEGDPSDLYKLGAIDATVNGLSFGAPGFKGVSEPMSRASRSYNTVSNGINKLNPMTRIGDAFGADIVAAGAQGGLEAGRQYGKTLVDERLKADPMMAGWSLAAGATRPALFGVTNMMGKPTGTFGKFTKGVNKASTVGDPVLEERGLIQEAWPGFERYRNANYMNSILPTTVEERFGTMTDAMAQEKAVKNLFKYADALGIDNERLMNMETKLDDILHVYDTKMGNKGAKIKTNWDPSTERIFVDENDAIFSDKFSSTFPQKTAELLNDNPTYRAGVVAGNVVGDLGSRVEPAFHITPSSLGVADYKDKPWYTEAGPKRQEIIDDTFKQQDGGQKSSMYRDWSEGKNIPPKDSILYQEYLAYKANELGYTFGAY